MEYTIAALAIVWGAVALPFLVEAVTGRRIIGRRNRGNQGDRSTAAAKSLIALGLALEPVAQLIRAHPVPSLLLTFLGLAFLIAGVAVFVWQGWSGRGLPEARQRRGHANHRQPTPDSTVDAIPPDGQPDIPASA